MINGITRLVVTKLDVLDDLAEIPVCIAYRVDGKLTSEVPAQAGGYAKIECVYEKLPGWQSCTEGITEYSKLPARAKEYLAFIEKETGAQIGMISTGPGREQTMLVGEFAGELVNFKRHSEQGLARAR
jgi:adenylosuccinate synthase